jgi:hypothetical protein
MKRAVMKRAVMKRAVMKRAAMKVRPSTRRTLRALGGRRVMIEGFGRHSPTLVVIAGSGEAPAGVWLSPAALRRFVDAARRILK